uniref:Uncharacterized protein n=1 Tax=Timema genevievae TaxID=629358 RepID=A0A7R9PP71_TIMGE|nr:unnamed protein product [Timema genevievae]
MLRLGEAEKPSTSSQAVKQANTPSTKSYVGPSVKKMLPFKNEETKEPSTPQLRLRIFIVAEQMNHGKGRGGETPLKAARRYQATKPTRSRATQNSTQLVRLLRRVKSSVEWRRIVIDTMFLCKCEGKRLYGDDWEQAANKRQTAEMTPMNS